MFQLINIHSQIQD